MSTTSVPFAELPGKQDPQGPKRLHYLDWLRGTMVFGVVGAHITRMGLGAGVEPNGHWGVPSDVEVDDVTWNLVDPASREVRWLSLARPVGIPILFWVSGAAYGLSFKKGAGKLRGMGRLAAITAAGMAGNAIAWFLSPMDPDCSVMKDCHGGPLFQFTVAPHMGPYFPVLFHMWYTVVLMALLVSNWPFMAVISGNLHPASLCGQWAYMVLAYVSFIHLSGADCPHPGSLAVSLAVEEAMFLIVSLLCSPTCTLPHSMDRVRQGIPIRVGHYCLAAVVILQFGVSPFAREVSAISFSFMLQITVGFNKFFQLGFVMLHSRKNTKVEAILSKCWPVTIALFIFVSPSSNWHQAGNLTYPFFPRVIDRLTYVLFAVMVIFTLETLGCAVDTAPMSDLLNWASLATYVVHPLLVTILVGLGLRSVLVIWTLVVLLGIALVAFVMRLTPRKV
mmetsp:Transcript_43504/g.79176  ORF Transcript_43504/g.79176 Transcript_43504/m.79176 type:complete len:449 (-) Transcript_43504:18-1364(-)